MRKRFSDWIGHGVPALAKIAVIASIIIGGIWAALEQLLIRILSV